MPASGMFSRRTMLGILATAPVRQGWAQGSRQVIRFIVPFTPGTGPDLLARILGEELRQRWNEPVITENKPGASGSIGTQAAARMRPAKAKGPRSVSRKQSKGGPGQRDPDRTRATVLSVARQEFAKLGLAGARVHEIVRIAGVSKQVVYYYFKSKDELFKAALLSSYEEIRVNNLEYVRKASGGSPETRLRNLIVHLFDRIGSHREVISLIVEENRYRGQHLRHSDLPYRSSEPMVEHLSEVLKEGQASALFKPKVDARQLYLDIFSMVADYVYVMENGSIVSSGTPEKPGFKTLISQVYDPADPNIETDVQFGVTRALMGDYVRHEEPCPEDPAATTPWFSLGYTFIMEPGEAVLPRPPIK